MMIMMIALCDELGKMKSWVLTDDHLDLQSSRVIIYNKR